MLRRPTTGLIALLTIVGCSGTPTSPSGARTFRFVMRGRPALTFVARTSDPAVLAQVDAQLALPFEKRNQHINGVVDRGDAGQNAPWNWHFVLDRWTMADASIEICDGTPTFVEENLELWLEQVGQYCPWDSVVDHEVL